MDQPKFSMNALVVVVSVFAALTLLVTVAILNTKNPFPVNEYYPVEGTNYAVRYSTYHPNGLYVGPENTCKLVLEGSFGVEWGCVKHGDTLYTNEYTMTDLGLVTCDFIKIDLNTLEKETLLRDTILRGKNGDGKLVCVAGFLMPSNAPATNPLCALYGMTAAGMDPRQRTAEVLFIDPATGEIAYRENTPDALSDDFAARYLAPGETEARK